jgi:predicted ribosome quality control (RQC) complex YloA/Tae2 family protein
MKKEMSAFDIFFVVKELQKLRSAKLEKVFHTKKNKNEVLFRFYSPEYGKLFLRVILPSFIYFTQYKVNNEDISGFGLFLRKHLTGSRLVEIKQKDFDRVIDFKFEIRKKGVIYTNHLIIELFSTGNMVLIGDNDKISGVIYSQRWKDRKIMPGKEYSFPESQFNVINCSKKEFLDKLKSSNKGSLVVALAASTSLGGEYAEEVCARAKIDKKSNLNDLSDEQMELLFSVIHNMKDNEPKGFLYEKSILPIKFSSSPLKQFETFCEALDEAVTQEKHDSSVKSSENKTEAKINKLDNILKKQEEMLNTIIDGSEIAQKKGEMIYEKYPELTNIINGIAELRKKKSWKEIKEEFSHKYPNLTINEKNNELIFNVE